MYLPKWQVSWSSGAPCFAVSQLPLFERYISKNVVRPKVGDIFLGYDFTSDRYFELSQIATSLFVPSSQLWYYLGGTPGPLFSQLAPL
jgi:hypothetical protein